jgi:hypothetical protein
MLLRVLLILAVEAVVQDVIQRMLYLWVKLAVLVL